jgi:hypothetical protein
MHENGMPRLRENPSFDMGWQTVDERDEVGLTSDEETDDLGGEDDEINNKEEERTSAIVVAEEGRGLIVKGESIPIIQLHVEPGECWVSLRRKFTMHNSPCCAIQQEPHIYSSGRPARPMRCRDS